MKEQTKKKNRFLAFFTSLCTSKTNRDYENSKDKNKSKYKVNKIPRLTFQLDRVLVKVSRKNVAEQQFMQNQVLTYHLQKYLASRFKQCDIAIFQGQFSNFLIQKIPFCLQIKSSKNEIFESENNYVLTNQNNKLKFRYSLIDLMVSQIYFGQNETNNKKIKKQAQSPDAQLKFQINSNLDRIQQTLRMYQKKVKNFVFVCHKDLKLQDVHDLFLVFKQNYFFEFEKVKKIQKTVCVIIYVSTETKFLRIDNASLSQFVLCEFDKMRAFGEVKKITQSTLGTNKQKDEKSKLNQPIKKEDDLIKLKAVQKIGSSKEGIKRQGFHILIHRMFERNLHLKVSQALAIILQSPEKKADKISWFLDLMQQKSPETKDLIDAYRIHPDQENQAQMNFTSSEFTPIFVQKFKDSNNFSKTTAIFDTQNNPQDEFMLIYSPGKNKQLNSNILDNDF